MKNISFCILAIQLLFVNSITSQKNETTEKEENNKSPLVLIDSEGKSSKKEKVIAIETTAHETITKVSNSKKIPETTNTNIILSEESKKRVLRTTLDFF